MTWLDLHPIGTVHPPPGAGDPVGLADLALRAGRGAVEAPQRVGG